MRTNSFSGLLAILLLVALGSQLFIVAAKPLGSNPDWTHWPAGTLWGAKLIIENNTSGGVFFGAKTGAEHVYNAPVPGFPPYIWMVFRQTVDQAEITRTEPSAPQSYTWYVKMLYNNSGTGDNVDAKIWAVLENDDTLFIPQDHSIILENTWLGSLNMRLYENLDTGATVNLVDSITRYATLYVDNAVNVENIENLDPLTGLSGDNLRLNVYVKNTGRYTDNYAVSAGGSLDPTIYNLAPGSTDNVIVTTTYPSGTENIVITAAGNYATDQDYVTATGALVRTVNVEITPNENFGENGETLTFDVCVKNTGSFLENYKLTVENVWEAWVSPTQLENLDPGENKHATLFVKIPDAANPGDSDNVTVTATSEENENVSDNATCVARVGFFSVEVSILDNHQETAPGGNLNYTVMVSNTGILNDSYNLTFTDNIDANTYWEDNISFDNSSLAVPAGENRTTTLRVTIPENAPPGTDDNITVTATSQSDNTVENSASCIAHVAIVRDVQVMIDPFEDSGEPDSTLDYMVTVMNTGNIADNFSLFWTDDAGWGDNIWLDDNSLWVAKGNENTTTLHVHIPICAAGNTWNDITVTAQSQTDITVESSEMCRANVEVIRGVEVQVTPKILENARRENVTFTITVMNKGNVADSFDLSWSDNENWGGNISILENVLSIPGCGENTATLRVHIPDNANPDTEDNITVTATSQADNTIKDNDSCIVRVVTARKVMVSISPGENSTIPGETLTYTVTVTNTGDNADNYVLHAIDNLGWNISLAENSLGNVAPGGRRTTALTVAIPEDAAPDTRDNITITATSRENENVTDNATCIARSIGITRGVSVSISPAEVDGMPGDNLSFTIKVTNTGNIVDNYDLTFSDNAGWSPSISEDTLEVPAGENRSVTLTVAVPDNATPETRDKITVTVTSRENATVSNSATCQIRALILRRVEVTISPGYRNGPPGAILNYTVRVTNTGWAADNYRLVVAGTSGWLASIDPEYLALEPGESGEAVLNITVPSNANGSSMIFYVWAISSVDSTVRANATCRALALVIEEGGGLSIPWLQIIIIAAIIVIVVFTVGYLTRRRGRGGRRMVLKGVRASL